MTASEVIAEIQRLPVEERAKVEVFIQRECERREKQPAPKHGAEVQYLDPDEARRISRRIFGDNAELFRKLAQ